MEPDRRIPVDIPDDLDETILQGIARGKQIAARRAKIKGVAVRSVCSAALVFAFFIGGINLSPAFAAAVEEVPVLGQLVRIFTKNQDVVQGGVEDGAGTAVLTMERSGDVERIRLEFGQADASLYRAEFASYPKTITVVLPGTSGVEVLSQISRAQDTSQYIKSVYQLPVGTEETAMIQLELESDADVQIEEYSDPGSLVIRLTPTPPQMDTVYSVRTLSFDGEEIRSAANLYGSSPSRLLRDDSGNYFLELAQYANQEDAQAACAALSGEVIVEQRTGNNVPVCFTTMEDYESDRFLDAYYQLLLSSVEAEPVLDFLEAHFASAAPHEQDVMLRGLTGFLQDTHEELDWARVAAFYQMAGQELPKYIQQHMETSQ